MDKRLKGALLAALVLAPLASCVIEPYRDGRYNAYGERGDRFDRSERFEHERAAEPYRWDPWR